MCKLLIMTGITEGLVAEEFMRRMAIPMSKTNAHGIGYTAVGPDGELFSQRWHDNDMFFDKTKVLTKDHITEIKERLKDFDGRLNLSKMEENYSELGNIDFSDVRSVTMHTRFATCGREFANTHPFIHNDTSLIHNGSISNAFSTHYRTGLDVNKISTCDSEAALQTYLSQGVNLDTTKAKEWLDLLSGSWAFGILSRNQQGNRVLDVIRGISRLYYMEVDGLGKVFTTDDDDAKGVVKDMGLTFIKEPIFVASDEMYRYDAITGEFLESVDIKPVYKSYGGYESSKSGGRRSSGTTNTTTSTSHSSTKSSSETLNVKRPGEALLALVDAFRDDPDAMSLMPDIFTDSSTPKDLKIDFRKVKKYGNDTRFPLLERLDIFDLVFNSNYVGMYQELPPALREYIRGTDGQGEGLKSVRGLITSLHEKKKDSVG
jgi:predicted glutamine amidotransferase